MKEHHIEITEDDIIHGKCADRHACALARALTRHFPQVGAVDVDLFDILLFGPDGGVVGKLSHTNESAKFVFEFDRQVERVDPQVVVLMEESPFGGNEEEVH